MLHGKQIKPGTISQAHLNFVLPTGAPTAANKEIPALVTTADGQPATAPAGALAFTPVGDGYVKVEINGVKASVGDGVKTKDCYFSADGGTTAKAVAAIAAGDRLYWNGSFAGYQLDTTDLVDLFYNA